METKKRNLYQLQTKLYQVEDTLVSFGPIQLTLRQCFVLILGGCGSLDIWHGLDTPSVIRLFIASIPLILSILIAGVRVADRYAEAWLLVLLAYRSDPRVYLWRQLKPHPDIHREDKDHA